MRPTVRLYSLVRLLSDFLSEKNSIIALLTVLLTSLYTYIDVTSNMRTSGVIWQFGNSNFTLNFQIFGKMRRSGRKIESNRVCTKKHMATILDLTVDDRNIEKKEKGYRSGIFTDPSLSSTSPAPAKPSSSAPTKPSSSLALWQMQVKLLPVHHI